jgi:hypothetical protein
MSTEEKWDYDKFSAGQSIVTPGDGEVLVTMTNMQAIIDAQQESEEPVDSVTAASATKPASGRGVTAEPDK